MSREVHPVRDAQLARTSLERRAPLAATDEHDTQSRMGGRESRRRIEQRTDRMLAAGLLEEAERIGLEAGAANAVGYREALAYLRGWSTRDELRAALVRATRRYAKRQATWLRSEPGLTVLSEDEAFERAVAAAGALPGWA